MPSNKYRRDLRNNVIVPVGTSNKYADYTIIQNYFYQVLDSITNHCDFISGVSLLQSIINNTQSTVDYYKLLDFIESNLMSVLQNITDNVNSNIIQTRINYIKTFIDQIPHGCIQLSPLSDMILVIVDSIIAINFSNVTSNVTQLQTYTQKCANNNNNIYLIQENLLSIVDNIKCGINSNIIAQRVEYVQSIINKIS
jgi:hypothetical protein